MKKKHCNESEKYSGFYMESKSTPLTVNKIFFFISILMLSTTLCSAQKCIVRYDSIHDNDIYEIHMLVFNDPGFLSTYGDAPLIYISPDKAYTEQLNITSRGKSITVIEFPNKDTAHQKWISFSDYDNYIDEMGRDIHFLHLQIEGISRTKIVCFFDKQDGRLKLISVDAYFNSDRDSLTNPKQISQYHNDSANILLEYLISLPEFLYHFDSLPIFFEKTEAIQNYSEQSGGQQAIIILDPKQTKPQLYAKITKICTKNQTLFVEVYLHPKKACLAYTITQVWRLSTYQYKPL